MSRDTDLQEMKMLADLALRDVRDLKDQVTKCTGQLARDLDKLRSMLTRVEALRMIPSPSTTGEEEGTS